MNDNALFLSAIRNAPDDLFLRLVYADWLEEQCDPRAAFLRKDDELHKRIAAAGPMTLALDPQVPVLLKELAKLGRTLDAEWVAFFTALRPVVSKCRDCRRLLAPLDAVDTHPQNQRKLRTTRYCKTCHEDRVRSRFDSRGEHGAFGVSRNRDRD